MREIKFRGKRVDTKEWVYGYYDGCYETATINYLKNGIPYNACVIPESVGQYTGLKDKNGVEIYEGDIAINESEELLTIVFRDGMFLGVLVGQKIEETESLFNCMYGVATVEVIGNVWENPSLLEVQP